MNWKSLAYKGLKYSNDLGAISKAVQSKSTTPIVKRGQRRVLGKMFGRLIGKMTR